MHKPELLSDQQSDSESDDKKQEKPAKKKNEAASRKSRKRNAKDAKKQPPDAAGTQSNKNAENDADEIDIDSLTDEEFDALPEATKARLRGD